MITLVSLAIIATLVTSSLLSTRGRMKLAANLKLAAEVESLADGMVHLMILDRIRALEYGQRSASRLPWDGTALTCALGDGTRAILRAEDEGGKIDLNAAPAPLLLALFEELQTPPSDAIRIVEIIETYRSKPRSNGRQGVVTIQELGTALPSDPLVVQALLPHVTVHARTPGIDLSVATAETRTLLARDGARTAPLLVHQPSASHVFRFKVQVTRANTRFQREALVQIKPDSIRQFHVSEWFRGTDYKDYIVFEYKDCLML